jgi:mannose-6-phosphate isomerase-like protein (cupin superfamily)
MTMAEFFKTEILAHPQEQVVFRPNELLDLTSQFPQSGDGGPEAHLSLRQVGDAHRHNLRILYEVYSPGADTGETMLEHESSEGGVVVSGELELTVGGAVYLLRTGDSFLFDSRRPHRFRNVSQFPTTVVSACAPPYL